MIQLGAIDWILQTLKSVARVDPSGSWRNLCPPHLLHKYKASCPDFAAEFTSALLMNLTLRSAGRKRIGALSGIDVLMVFIEHPNPQVRTHVNGTLFSLFESP